MIFNLIFIAYFILAFYISFNSFNWAWIQILKSQLIIFIIGELIFLISGYLANGYNPFDVTYYYYFKYGTEIWLVIQIAIFVFAFIVRTFIDTVYMKSEC
jgi:hypothetical protein